MHLLALYTSQRDPHLAERLLKCGWWKALDRVLLFGAVAFDIAEYARTAKQALDDAYLDQVATHLLDETQDVPKRDFLDTRYQKFNCVGPHEDEGYLPLVYTERAVEIAGVAVCMGLAQAKLDDEDLSNADMWIAGTRSTPMIDPDKRVFSPGDFAVTSRALHFNIQSSKVEAGFMDESGALFGSSTHAFVSRTKMSVNG